MTEDQRRDHLDEIAAYQLDNDRNELRDQVVWINDELLESDDPVSNGMSQVWCELWTRIQEMVCGERFDASCENDGTWGAYTHFVPLDLGIDDPVRLDWMLLLLERLRADEIAELSEIAGL